MSKLLRLMLIVILAPLVWIAVWMIVCMWVDIVSGLIHADPEALLNWIRRYMLGGN